MTYETRIGIEIAGIRRSIPLSFHYRVEKIGGRQHAIHDSVHILNGNQRLPGEWIYKAIGTRQLRELDEQLIEYWKSGKAL